MSEFSSIGTGVNGTGSVGPLNRISPVHHSRAGMAIEPKESAAPPVDTDRVELSDRARFLDMLRQFPDVRQDRIDRVKQAIEAGVYDSEDKIDAAILEWAREELA
jgi:anti-sigma28 factor (negative regulator of flagellin synthesis)